MGWRQGKGVGGGGARGAMQDGAGGRWGRVAGVGPENVPLYRLEPKDNVHGLGFDPFKARVIAGISCLTLTFTVAVSLTSAWSSLLT